MEASPRVFCGRKVVLALFLALVVVLAGCTAGDSQSKPEDSSPESANKTVTGEEREAQDTGSGSSDSQSNITIDARSSPGDEDEKSGENGDTGSATSDGETSDTQEAADDGGSEENNTDTEIELETPEDYNDSEEQTGPNISFEPGSWPIEMHSPARTNYNPEAEDLEKQPSKEWTYDTERSIGESLSDPAVSNSTVYISSNDTLHAIRAGNGKRKWDFEVNRTLGQPAATHETVYVSTSSKEGSGPGTLYALDTGTGREKWRYTAEVPLMGRALPVSGSIYLTSSRRQKNGELYRVNTQGKLVKKLSLDNRTLHPPTVKDGRLFLALQDSINSFDIDNSLSQVWEIEDIGITSPLVAKGDRIYLTSTEGFFLPFNTSLQILNTTDGSIIDRKGIENNAPRPPAASENSLYLFSNSENEDQISITSTDTSGGKKWDASFDSSDGFVPSTSGEMIYVSTISGTVHALDQGGNEIWSWDAGSSLGATPSIAGKSMYLATEDGKVHALKKSAD